MVLGLTKHGAIVPLETPNDLRPAQIILLSEFRPPILIPLAALLVALRSICRTRMELQLENLALRHQIACFSDQSRNDRH